MTLSILLGAAFVFGTIALAWGVYFGMRAAVGQEHSDQTRELAGSVIFRVSALHGLILALVFAQELYDYTTLRDDLVREATAAADIYNDIRRYGTESEDEIRQAVSEYVAHVAQVEWPALGDDQRLSPEGWRLREVLYLGALDLEPETLRQEDLRDHLIAKAQLIAELRQSRETTALDGMSPLFWIAAVAGIVLVTLPYFIFPTTRLNLALLSVYGGFTGLVMFIIYAFSDPFSEPGALRPVAFERLLETEIGADR